MTNGQIAKAVATHPGVLGLGIEQNLKPTVHWFLDLGLTKKDVAKLAATFPQILGLSMEQNLKPTVDWFLEFDVMKHRLAARISSWPRLLGYSIANNLEPKALLLETLFTRDGAREIIANNPEILRFSHRRMATRLSILSRLGETSKAYYAMSMSDESFQKRFSSRCSSWRLEWRSSGIVVIHMKVMVADRLLERAVGKTSVLHLSLHNEVTMTPLEGGLHMPTNTRRWRRGRIFVMQLSKMSWGGDRQSGVWTAGQISLRVLTVKAFSRFQRENRESGLGFVEPVVHIIHLYDSPCTFICSDFFWFMVCKNGAVETSVGFGC